VLVSYGIKSGSSKRKRTLSLRSFSRPVRWRVRQRLLEESRHDDHVPARRALPMFALRARGRASGEVRCEARRVQSRGVPPPLEQSRPVSKTHRSMKQNLGGRARVSQGLREQAASAERRKELDAQVQQGDGRQDPDVDLAAKSALCSLVDGEESAPVLDVGRGVTMKGDFLDCELFTESAAAVAKSACAMKDALLCTEAFSMSDEENWRSIVAGVGESKGRFEKVNESEGPCAGGRLERRERAERVEERRGRREPMGLHRTKQEGAARGRRTTGQGFLRSQRRKCDRGQALESRPAPTRLARLNACRSLPLPLDGACAKEAVCEEERRSAERSERARPLPQTGTSRSPPRGDVPLRATPLKLVRIVRRWKRACACASPSGPFPSSGPRFARCTMHAPIDARPSRSGRNQATHESSS